MSIKLTEKDKHFYRNLALRNALKTTQKEKIEHEAYEWYKRATSDDPKTRAKIFRAEWPEFEKLIKSEKDKKRLKKLFNIK